MEERDERQKDMCVSVHGHGTPPLSRTGINRQVETGVGRAEGIREIYCSAKPTRIKEISSKTTTALRK